MRINYEFTDSETFYKFFRENRPKLFKENLTFDLSKIFSETEKEKLSENRKNMESIKSFYLFARGNNKIIWWSFWRQENAEVFYMVNSAVFPEYRNKWVYTEMLKIITKKATQEWFVEILSKHIISNNPIIIAKLKFWFYITWIEVSINFWTLVSLTYFPNKLRSKILNVRTWNSKMDDEVINLIK